LTGNSDHCDWDCGGQFLTVGGGLSRKLSFNIQRTEGGERSNSEQDQHEREQSNILLQS
jgi:hypothetical protein